MKPYEIFTIFFAENHKASRKINSKVSWRNVHGPHLVVYMRLSYIPHPSEVDKVDCPLLGKFIRYLEHKTALLAGGEQVRVRVSRY